MSKDASLPQGSGFLNILQGSLGASMVQVDLMKHGYPCFIAAEGLAYDLVVDVNNKLYRVQVKSTRHARRRNEAIRSDTYLFRLQRSETKRRHRRYSVTDFDILALVVIETGEIAYLDKSYATQARIQLKPAGYPKHARRKTTHNIDELPLSRVLKKLKGAA